MKLKELIDVINKWDNKIQVRIGNDMYNDIVEDFDTITGPEKQYNGEYADYIVDCVETIDYGYIRIWVYKNN